MGNEERTEEKRHVINTSRLARLTIDEIISLKNEGRTEEKRHVFRGKIVTGKRVIESNGVFK